MALGLKLGSFALLRLNLGPKAVLSAALLIAVNTVLVVGAGYWSLTRDFDTRANRDIDVNLRTLSLAFGETFPGAKIAIRDGVVERIEIPQMPDSAITGLWIGQPHMSEAQPPSSFTTMRRSNLFAERRM